MLHFVGHFLVKKADFTKLSDLDKISNETGSGTATVFVSSGKQFISEEQKFHTEKKRQDLPRKFSSG